MALVLAAGMSGVNWIVGGDSEANTTVIRYICRAGTYAIDKARTMLGYAPLVDLGEGMRRTEGWLRETGRLTYDH